MVTVASRDLRNHTSEVLRQASAGTPVTITVNGRPVAELRAVSGARQQFLTRSEVAELLLQHQADPGLSADLDALTNDTTDDLDAL